MKKPLTVSKAKEIVEEYLTWTVIDDTGPLLLDAIALQRKAQLSFWDSLIVQAAIHAGCDKLYSEDMNDIKNASSRARDGRARGGGFYVGSRCVGS